MTMNIDEVLDRLVRGEVLVIDDQWRSYISMEAADGPERFVVRSVLQRRPGDTPTEWRDAPQKRYRSLVEALLSLEDYEWISK
jgi:hypothetical protein